MEKKTSEIHILVTDTRKKMLVEKAQELGVSISALLNLVITDYFKGSRSEG